MDDEYFEELVSRLDNEKQQNIRSMKDYHTAHTALTSALFIKYVIRLLLRLRYDEMEFATNQYNKPYLAGNDMFHYNLSHSGEWVVCAVDETPIGIDIEKMDHHPKLPLDVLSPEEKLAYDSFLGPMDKSLFFYKIWTRKESYIKAIGIGLQMPLDGIDVFSQNKKGIIFPVVDSVRQERVLIKEYYLDKDYALAVCAIHENFAEKINCISDGEVFN